MTIDHRAMRPKIGKTLGEEGLNERLDEQEDDV